jgi:NitT/TauT family transport system substrate-binding protein
MIRKCAIVLMASLGLGGPTSAASAADKAVICALRFVSSSPVFIAADKGYFAAEGLDATIKFFEAAAPIAVAVSSGDCDFGVTGLTGGLYNLAGKGGVVIIGAQSREQPGFQLDGYVVSNQAYAAGFHAVTDFPGKSVGITQVGSTMQYEVEMLAEKIGFPISAVQLKPLQSVPNMVAAIKGGQVDVILMVAPIARELERSGEAKIVGWVGDQTPWQLGALFTSPKNIAERRPVVVEFVRAWQRAATDYNAAFNQLDKDGKRIYGPAADALIPIIQNYVQPAPPPETIKAGAPYIDPLGRLRVGNIYDQVAWYKANGLVDADVDAAKFIDLSFIEGHFEVPGK